MTEQRLSVAGPVLSAADFRAAFSVHPSGVAVITADAGDGPVALTATSVVSVSAEPSLLLFSVATSASSATTLTRAETVLIHLLGADALPVAVAAATHGVDRFADESAWTRLPSGEPLFLGVPVWIRARVVQRIEAGAATVVLAEALASSVSAEHPPLPREGLVYVHRAWHRLAADSRLIA